MVKGLGKNFNVRVVAQKTQQVAKNTKHSVETTRNILTKPLQGGISSIGKESNYSNYIDIMA